jgi:hypothetical protein
MSDAQLDLSQIEQRVGAVPTKSVVPDSFAAWLLDSTYSIPPQEADSNANDQT